MTVALIDETSKTEDLEDLLDSPRRDDNARSAKGVEPRAPTKAAQKRAAAAQSATAAEAYLRERVLDPVWLPSTGALSFSWEPTGEDCCWRVFSREHLRRDALRVIGPLETFAWSINGRATPTSVWIALQVIAQGAPVGEGLPDSGLEEEDKATRLVRALLFGPIETWVEGPDGTGHRERVTLASCPGSYPGYGVKLRRSKKNDHAALLVNLTTAAQTVLRDHQDFGRRSPAALARVLRAYPGLATSRSRHAAERGHGPEGRQGRWWILDVTLELDDPRADNAREGMDLESVRAFAEGRDLE